MKMPASGSSTSTPWSELPRPQAVWLESSWERLGFQDEMDGKSLPVLVIDDQGVGFAWLTVLLFTGGGEDGDGASVFVEA